MRAIRYRIIIAVEDCKQLAPCVIRIIGYNIVVRIHYLLDIALCVGSVEVAHGCRRAAYIANSLPDVAHLVIDEVIDILDRRAALRALHSYDLAAVENIAVGISAAYIFLDAYSVLIIIIIDGSTVYPRVEQLPAHLPSQGIASAVIVRQRVAYLVIGDGVSVIGGQQVAPRGVFIAVGVLYSHSCGIRALGLGNIAETVVRIARHIRSDSYIRIRAVLGYQP